MAASNLPLSVVISHCPKMGPCPLQDLRKTQIAMDHHLTYVEHDCTGSEVMQDEDKQNLGSAQAASLFNKQNSRSCFSELEKVS